MAYLASPPHWLDCNQAAHLALLAPPAAALLAGKKKGKKGRVREKTMGNKVRAVASVSVATAVMWLVEYIGGSALV